ncbi:hypothetical protein [Micromonospora sp. SH-82]|uniref:hypothetical protein n=1 Tax=Micromonospora sp. SH-82 TaxID=3132938 RepID=UPI003EBD8CF9
MPSPKRNGEEPLTTYLTPENQEQFKQLPPEVQQRLVDQSRDDVNQMALLTTAILKQEAVQKRTEEAKAAGATHVYSGVDRKQRLQKNENHIRFYEPRMGGTVSFLLKGHQVLKGDRQEFDVIQAAKLNGVYASEKEIVANQKEYDKLHEATNTRVSSEFAEMNSNLPTWQGMATLGEFDPALTTAAAQAQVPQFPTSGPSTMPAYLSTGSPGNGLFFASGWDTAPKKLTKEDFAEMNRPRIVRPSQYGGGGRAR